MIILVQIQTDKEEDKIRTSQEEEKEEEETMLEEEDEDLVKEMPNVTIAEGMGILKKNIESKLLKNGKKQLCQW